MNDLKAPELLTTMQRIENRNAITTARKALQICGQIFRYAEVSGKVERDVTQALKGALSKPTASHFASQIEPDKVKELLNTLDCYTGGFVVKAALRLAPLVFVRPNELRTAEWEHIDLESREWRYTVTKTNTLHVVPLSRQAIEILTELKTLTGKGRYVFPSERTPNGSRAMSEMAMIVALRRLGITKEEMTVHGFRAMARTILDEVLKFRPDFIEHQLAHSVRDANGRAYNRTSHLPERHKMMQAWADYLDNLKQKTNVIALRKMA